MPSALSGLVFAHAQRTSHLDLFDVEKSAVVGSESLFQELVERANDIFVVVGGDGYIQLVNHSYCRLTGLGREEIEGDRIAVLFEPADRVLAQERLTNTLQLGPGQVVNLPLRVKEGLPVDISFRALIERGEEGSIRRMMLIGQSPFLYGDLADQFNNLHRDLKNYSIKLERLNAELEQRIEERTARLKALIEVSASLNAELQLDALFEMILRQATETIAGAEAGALLLHNPETDRLVVQATCGYDGPELIQDLQSELTRLNTQVLFLDRGVRVWSGNPRERAGHLKYLLRNTDQFRIRAAVCAPIATPSERLGFVLLHNFDEPNAFSEDDIALVSSLAGTAAVAIINARLYEQTSEQAERLELVNRLSASVRDSIDLEQTLGLAVEGLSLALGASRAAVTLFDENSELAFYSAQYSEPGIKTLDDRRALLLGTPLMREVLGFREPRSVSQARTDPRVAEARPAFAELGVESLVVVPLVVRDRFVGTVELHECNRIRQWEPTEIGLVEQVAKQVATAVHQVRLHAKLRETVRESQALYRAASILIDTSDLDALLDQILTAIDDEFSSPRTAILLLGPQRTNLYVQTTHGHPAESMGHHLATDAPGIISYVARNRKAVNVADVRLDPRYIVGWEECRSELALPLVVDNELIGVLDLQSDKLATFTDRDLRILAPFAERAAFAIRQAQLNRDLQQSVHETTALYEATAAIASAPDLATKLDTICRVVHDKLGWGVVVLSLVDEVDNHSKAVSVVGLESEQRDHVLSAPSVPLSHIEDLGERFLFSRSYFFDHRRDPNWFESVDTYVHENSIPYKGNDAWHPDDALVVPIVLDGRILGRISVDAPADGKRPTLPKVRQLELFADQAAVVINQANLFEKVAHAKREWETTFDAMSDAVFLFDAEKRLVRANAAASALENRSFKELTGSPCCQILADVEEHECMVDRAILEHSRQTFEWSRGIRTYSITVDPVTDGEKRTLGVVAVVRDLSELREAERESKRQRDFLSHIMENVYDLMCLLDVDGCVVWHNRALRDVTGFPEEKLRGLRLLDTLGGEHAQSTRTCFARALAGESQIAETILIDAVGGNRDIVLTLAPVFDRDTVTGVLCIGRDVTDEKLSAEKSAEADKLRALGQLASGVAHDFNNLLAAILGRSQLLKRSVDDDALVEGLDVIIKAALDGASTVRRIQTFARQRMDSDFTAVDVGAVVTDAIEITRTRWRNDAQSHGLNYDVTYSADGEAYTLADESELREVFVNLIINAVDAMPDGGTLSISVESEGRWVKTTFADTGVGISDAVRRRMFEPFFTTKGDKGTGLGLSVSYGIVSRLNGRIEAVSGPGPGATFVVVLPSSEAAPVQTPTLSEGPVRCATILVIDDEPAVRDVLVDMLTLHGHDVLAVDNGAEGLARLDETAYDVVFTDLSMPGMDGWAVARGAKQRRPEAKIVLVTGYAASISPNAIDDHSVDAIVGKPFDFDTISETLRSILL